MEKGGEGKGGPQSQNAQSVGLGSKMQAVLTATEGPEELGRKGKQGEGDGMSAQGIGRKAGPEVASGRRQSEVPTCCR